MSNQIPAYLLKDIEEEAQLLPENERETFQSRAVIILNAIFLHTIGPRDGDVDKLRNEFAAWYKYKFDLTTTYKELIESDFDDCEYKHFPRWRILYRPLEPIGAEVITLGHRDEIYDGFAETLLAQRFPNG